MFVSGFFLRRRIRRITTAYATNHKGASEYLAEVFAVWAIETYIDVPKSDGPLVEQAWADFVADTLPEGCK